MSPPSPRAPRVRVAPTWGITVALVAALVVVGVGLRSSTVSTAAPTPGADVVVASATAQVPIDGAEAIVTHAPSPSRVATGASLLAVVAGVALLGALAGAWVAREGRPDPVVVPVPARVRVRGPPR